MKILVLNSGSSSQKACLYEIGESLPNAPPACLWEGRIEWKDKTAAISIRNSAGAIQDQTVPVPARQKVVTELLCTAWSGRNKSIGSAAEIDAVGHRVVHGGPHFEEPVALTPTVRSDIESVAPFAPLHIRAEMEGVDVVDKLLGSVPQFAVFDTGFHRKIPLAAAVYPGPYSWFERGIRRYGFHGINHQYCAIAPPSCWAKTQNLSAW